MILLFINAQVPPENPPRPYRRPEELSPEYFAERPVDHATKHEPRLPPMPSTADGPSPKLTRPQELARRMP